jgi:hypothetical protein
MNCFAFNQMTTDAKDTKSLMQLPSNKLISLKAAIETTLIFTTVGHERKWFVYLLDVIGSKEKDETKMLQLQSSYKACSETEEAKLFSWMQKNPL